MENNARDRETMRAVVGGKQSQSGRAADIRSEIDSSQSAC